MGIPTRKKSRGVKSGGCEGQLMFSNLEIMRLPNTVCTAVIATKYNNLIASEKITEK